jgi:hypothetical protein
VTETDKDAMLSKRHAAALALIASLVAPGSFSAPALAQDFPEVTVLRSTPVFRNPGHRPFHQLAKGERVMLHECTELPGYCQITLRTPGRRLTGWVNSEALDGVVTTK